MSQERRRLIVEISGVTGTSARSATVTRDEFKDTDMLKKIGSGRPRVLSGLKSFSETGKALDTWA